ncbi:hypothetical protein NESM_000785800 [Novymonas esmeraldas]|uniref:Uncharacterized protein n=1 Tax=Novymonas esmeraldas TaxID=1808958 RepID=A0AAW0EWA1_9TRYP
MPRKKKEEVCGKPNQYNLQTLEYDWRELPDTHVQVSPQQPRVRDYSAFAGYGPPGQRLNPITHEPLPSPGVGAAAASPTPLPSPSRPAQEEVRQRRSSPQLHNGKRDHVAELFGGAVAETPPRRAPRQPPPPPLALEAPSTPRDALPRGGSPVPALPYPSAGMYGALGGATPHGYAAPAPPAAPAAAPWSHEDIKRVLAVNSAEALRSYLR